MSEPAETKNCPLCAEPIKASAKLCPYCRSRQGRLQVYLGEMGAALLVLPIVLVAIAYLAWRYPDDKQLAQYRGFVLHRKDLGVIPMQLELIRKGSQMWLSGIVTNKGTQPWRVHQLEVKAYDSHNNLIDVQEPDFDKSFAFVVLPNTEHAFRVALDTRANKDTNVVLRARVTRASDATQAHESE